MSFLTGGIEYLNRPGLAINDGLFPVRLYTIQSRTKGSPKDSE